MSNQLEMNMGDMEVGINEMFYSIQGESTFSGIPTYFIRFQGCNLKCNWCDSAYTFGEGGELMKIEDIIKKMEDEVSHLEKNAFFVCITGGEPLVQSKELFALCNEINRKWGDRVIISIETNGKLPIPWRKNNIFWIVDIKCPSSGHEFSRAHIMDVIRTIGPNDELKFVIQNESDFYFASNLVISAIPQAIIENRNVIFSPCAGDKSWPKKLADMILIAGLPVRYQMQLHKILWPEAERGV